MEPAYKYNARCPAVKRLLKEAKELHEATEEYFAHPLDDNLFEWHFTVRGPPDTEFEGGIYHGRIIMPSEYPMKPPNIIFFTANGRFETNKKICLSISGHHPETWQPSWSIRTALLAIIGFMPTPANGTIGGLEYTAAERSSLAKRSVDYVCSNCGRVGELLKERTGDNAELQKEAREVSAQMVVTEKKEDIVEEKKLSNSEQILENADADNTLPAESRTTNSNIPLNIDGASQSSPVKPGTSQSSPVKPGVSSSPSNSDLQQHSPTSVDASNLPPSLGAGAVPVSPQVGVGGRETMNRSSSSLALIANNILLSAAVSILIALVLRRLFLLESESTEDMDDILL